VESKRLIANALREFHALKKADGSYAVPGAELRFGPSVDDATKAIIIDFYVSGRAAKVAQEAQRFFARARAAKQADAAKRTAAINRGIAKRFAAARLRAEESVLASAESAVVDAELKMQVDELLDELDRLDPAGAQASKERRETRRLLKHYRENIEPFIPRG
jgi:hypothetical protein